MHGDRASNGGLWVALVAVLTVAKPVLSGTSALYYPDSSNLVATAVSYRYSLPKYSCPVFTFDATLTEQQKANGVIFYVNKPEHFGGKFFFLDGGTNNQNTLGLEQYYFIGKQYFFKFSEIEDEIHMSISPKDLVNLMDPNLRLGRHLGLPYFSVIQDANEYKEKMEKKNV